MGFDPAGLVESLPRDPAVIEATRQNVAGPRDPPDFWGT